MLLYQLLNGGDSLLPRGNAPHILQARFGEVAPYKPPVHAAHQGPALHRPAAAGPDGAGRGGPKLQVVFGQKGVALFQHGRGECSPPHPNDADQEQNGKIEDDKPLAQRPGEILLRAHGGKIPLHIHIILGGRQLHVNAVAPQRLGLYPAQGAHRKNLPAVRPLGYVLLVHLRRHLFPAGQVDGVVRHIVNNHIAIGFLPGGEGFHVGAQGEPAVLPHFRQGAGHRHVLPRGGPHRAGAYVEGRKVEGVQGRGGQGSDNYHEKGGNQEGENGGRRKFVLESVFVPGGIRS